MSRIEEFEKRLQADPNSRMFVQLAEEYRKEGLLENAVEICEEGLKKHPQYPSARVALGRALLESESFDRAAEEFETVLAQVPDNILANKFLGETYHRMGRLDEALQKYQIAQTLAPEDTELEGKIQAARDESAGGAPAPLAPETPPPQFQTPSSAGSLPEPPAMPSMPQMPQMPQMPPMPPVPPVPPVPPEEEALDSTFADPAGASGLPSLEAPVPERPAETFFEGELPPVAPEDRAPEPEPEPELAPIPLVDVTEPMVLEGPAYAAADTALERPESETVSTPAPEPLEATPDGEEVFELAGDEPESPPPEPARVQEPFLAAPEPPSPPLEPAPAMDADELGAPLPQEPFLAAPEPPSPPLEPAPAMGSADELGAPLPQEPFLAAPEPPSPPLEPGPAVGSADEVGTPLPIMDEIETPTMAELYASQGHFDRAVAVYRNLLVRSPNETPYRERIEELEMLASAAALPKARAPHSESRDGLSAEARQNTIEILDEWLDAIRRSREA